MIPSSFVWMDGKIAPWKNVSVPFVTHALHYGTAVYEGIRIYPTTKGPAIFRLDDHLLRFFESARLFGMSLPYSQDQLKKAIISLAQKNKLSEGYIRPLAFYAGNYMGFDVRKAQVKVGIAMWSWEKYAQKNVLSVKISPFEKISSKATKPHAKIAGHYALSVMALQEAFLEGYDSCVLLDNNKKVTEGPSENIFMVKKEVLITPKPGNVLLGVTRDCILMLAKDLGIAAKEKEFSVRELLLADEAFFTGTGSELLGIGSVNKKKIGSGSKGAMTLMLERAYQDVVSGKNKNYRKWLTYF